MTLSRPRVRLRPVALFLSFVVAIGVMSAPSAAAPAPVKRWAAPSTAAYVPGEVLVTFRPGAGRAVAGTVHALLGARVRRHLPGSVDLIRLPPGISVAEGIAAYGRDPAVEAAEPNLIRALFEHIPQTDPGFGDQWAHRNTGQTHTVGDCPFEAPGCTAAGTPDADGDTGVAWDTTKGAPGTVIAVMDNGVDTTHPDLNPNLWINPGDGPGGGDNDGNGYVDDEHGCDFSDRNCSDGSLINPPDPNGEFTHGTHVAGTAVANDDLGGVVGVCPDCRIMVLKIADQQGALTMDAELAAFAYAERMGADVINASFGGPEWSRAERNAIASLQDEGILVVAAAGNCALDNDLALASAVCGSSPSFPASYTLPNILSVAASNHHDQYGYGTACEQEPDLDRSDCLFTHWGRRSVDVAAPGVDIVSTVPVGTTATYDGTSMAAPFASGVAGLVKTLHPTYGAAELKAAIMNGADHPTALDTMPLFGDRVGTFTASGDGRVNAAQALGGSTTPPESAGDDVIEGARPIRRVRRGVVSWPDDVNDVYRKKLRPGRYRVFLDGPRGRDLDLVVWKPRTTEIWQFEAGCLNFDGGPCRMRAISAGPTAQETIPSMRVRRRGVFYFHVSAFMFERGRYRLVVRRLGACDPSYPTVCVPPPPPDVDCGDIAARSFPVRGPDVHKLDGDKNGIACESKR